VNRSFSTRMQDWGRLTAAVLRVVVVAWCPLRDERLGLGLGDHRAVQCGRIGVSIANF
jgi:hypothetical protein